MARALGVLQFTATSTPRKIGNADLKQLLSAATVSPNAMLVSVEGADIRWTDDPRSGRDTISASAGTPLLAGETLYLRGGPSNFQFVAQSGSPVVRIHFYIE